MSARRLLLFIMMVVMLAACSPPAAPVPERSDVPDANPAAIESNDEPGRVEFILDTGESMTAFLPEGWIPDDEGVVNSLDTSQRFTLDIPTTASFVTMTFSEIAEEMEAAPTVETLNQNGRELALVFLEEGRLKAVYVRDSDDDLIFLYIAETVTEPDAVTDTAIDIASRMEVN